MSRTGVAGCAGVCVMATAPAKPCRRCKRLTRRPSGLCEVCETKKLEADRKKTQAYDRSRGSACARGYDRRWQRSRLIFLAENPLCVECLKAGRVTPATDVDHIEPHKGDMTKFWKHSNWQALCRRCHSAKTAREDGGLGNHIKNRDNGEG